MGEAWLTASIPVGWSLQSPHSWAAPALGWAGPDFHLHSPDEATQREPGKGSGPELDGHNYGTQPSSLAGGPWAGP